MKMVRNGAHKCGKKIISMEEKMISEDENVKKNSFQLRTDSLRGSRENIACPWPSSVHEEVTKNSLSSHEPSVAMVNKAIDATRPQTVKTDNFALSKDYFPMHGDTYRPSEGQSKQLFTGVMTFMMGIVTMVRMTNNMPRKLTDATIYSSSMHDADSIKTNPAISSADFLSMIKRVNALEEQASFLSKKPVPAMPPEKEEMLNAALHRADRLEQELAEMRKALEDTLVRQDEFMAYIEKKKNRKKFFAF